MTNLEFRADIYKLIGLTIFSDGGILTSQISSVSFSNMKWNAGLGMTIRTPLGPFRIDYAYRLQENKESRVQLVYKTYFNFWNYRLKIKYKINQILFAK